MKRVITTTPAILNLSLFRNRYYSVDTRHDKRLYTTLLLNIIAFSASEREFTNKLKT